MGIAGAGLALTALARADKVLGRLRRAGLDPPADGGEQQAAAIGAELLALVRRAHAAGVDPEAALRVATRRLETAARTAGRAASSG